MSIEAPERVLMLCADDFGMSPGVSKGIARLARRERLGAVSCLTGMPHWRSAAPLLAELPASVDAGLHFNLTEGEPVSAELRRHWPTLPSLQRLIVAAHARRLPLDALAAEFAAQRAAFIDASGREPAFIDGHQHVHHLPGVREVVLDAIGDAGAPVRNTARVGGPGFGLKRALIAGTGGWALQRELRRRGLRHNAVLLGVYDFVPGRYRQWMQGWLAAVPAEGALLFCHPGDPDDSGVADPIARARGPEADYLASDAFADDLAAAGVVLGRAWRRIT
ncbi:MAG TPA: ChbG/HpnK family deacetylase [Albitalea sp.]|uniref:ChbG/HpnK family deacetylase n=1 Tax=Piscinibacter sp. TaxID=1903157 RepID=UPI002ED5A73F